MLKRRHRPPYKRESFPSECSIKKHLSTCSTVANHLLMKISSILSIVLLIAVVSMRTVSSDEWNVGDGGLSRWQSDCRYVGDYITLKSSSPDQCGGVCIAQSGCTHFTHGDGHCYMYNAPDGKHVGHRGPGWVCGYIPSRAG
uniref:Apple domain-containing protein n=1 Tax=Daphnia galeata TaxID=27404 RepID=A0A8J2RP00_9CRUS|nr:unnamed protein product [Daphnia galeata]